MVQVDARREPSQMPIWKRVVSRLSAEGLVVFAVAIWWLLSQELPEIIIPKPTAVAQQIWVFFSDITYISHVAASTVRVILGVIIAVALGSLLALIPHWVPIMDVIVHERIKPFLNSFPSVGWAILAIIWFGPSDGTIVFIIVMILTPFCLVNVSEGLKEIDHEVLEMARSFTRRPVVILIKVTLPLLMPYIISAVRIAYGVGWKIALVAELFGTESGLGFLLQQAQSVADAATVFATCLAIVIIFWIGEKVVIDPLSQKFAPEPAST
ncbi:MAG: ABC transporter permease subunit [Rhodospirillales bacterium]|nr:ABC transporter permease subunit [Rhodospirillales bacterium]